ncbi:dynactin subunit 1-like [Bactrocera neohumeralis]|uniref:dynactin subunit 1-like n=1 Tax=Bactrocera neohumeralis TaxID=98809 RepID=UPI00216523D4|nr:dynactin subunit 1-like [Bactrocera neohumeralis]
MAERSFKIGQNVQIVGRNLRGQIAYVGLTSFSPGKWIGVVLDEKDKGKNNGTVKGTTYFKCPANCGLFVRPAQLILIRDCETDEMTEPTALEASKSSGVKPAGSEKSATATPASGKAVEKSETKSQKSDGSTTVHTEAPNINTTATSNGNLLKATKINQPLQANQRVISSNTQLELSFTGATVSVAAPKRSKTTVSPSESFCCVRQRSAFVETGFLEILHTQFTPGHPLRSPTVFNLNNGSHSALAISPTEQLQQQQRQQQRYKDLEEQNAKLNDELNELKSQRLEDKRRLHELEKIRLQKEHLSEFKTQIMEQHSMLQRELQRCRQELREANEHKTMYKRELDEVAENIELLTLDKEMAEERVETLQIELETANERVEELMLDIEILRAENDNATSATTGVRTDNGLKEEIIQPSATEIKRLEQYNQRLRETVVRLRDVLTHEKQDLQKAKKELETKTSEISELKKTKEILSKRIDVMEMHIIDLKEQVDAALGAESMVTSLAESKIELEERVKLLEEEVIELEALEEIHEQIIEGNQELELDLREEIDALNLTIKMLQEEKNNTLETIYDRDVTIMKFRELVKTLNNNILSKDPPTNVLGIATGTGTSTSDDLSSTLSNQDETQSIDFNQMFSVTKACERAIDSRLNAIELKLCKAHIGHLLAFVPEEIMLRGCEYDIILVLLLLQRLYEKIEIICHIINEKFPSSCEFAKNTIFEGFSVHRFAFRCKCLYVLRSLKLVIKQLIFGLNHCDYEVCTHAAIYRGEMETQEKSIDELIKRLKGDMLDENTPMESVERTLSFFNTLYTNLICSQNLAELIDEQQLYVMLVEVLDVCLDCINTNAGILHTIIQLGDENTESFWAMQFLMENVNQFKQKLRKLQRKLPAAAVDISAMQQQQIQRIQHILTTNEHFGRFINILIATAKDATKDISTSSFSANGERLCDAAIEHKKLWKIIITNCTKYAAEEKPTPIALFHHCIQQLDEIINELTIFISENESVRSANKNTMFVRSSATTLLQRSMQLKQHSEDIKSLKHSLTERDKEIKTQKYLAKMKQNEFSEMQIRKEIAERNLSKVQRSQEEALTQITEYIEQFDKLICQREHIIAQSFNIIKEKLFAMEQNHARLEQKLISRKAVINISTDESYREIETLNKCLRYERAERCKLHIDEMKLRMRSFEPLYVPHQRRMVDATETRLAKELLTLKNQWILSHIKLKPVTENERCTLKRKSNELLQRTWSTYFKTHPHRSASNNFGAFGTKDVNQIFN